MRRAVFVAFLSFLPGCATKPSILPDKAIRFPSAEWTPMAGTLLESTETAWGSIATAGGKRPAQENTAPPPQSDRAASTVATPPPAPAKADTSSPPAASPLTNLLPANAEPAIEYAKPGERVKLAVSADGTPPFIYQWRKNGRPLPNGTSAVLIIAKATTENVGTYDCIVSNSAGTKTSPPVKLVIRP